MKLHQTAHILSTYSADTFGVCSALFELGGMIVMHDPSGCNSTYTTHDEPRWYDTDSLIFISGLNEQDAVLGRDDRFIRDVTESARQFEPAFICIIPSQITFLIGTDMKALTRIIGQQTSIPCFTLPTNSMHYYARGIYYALEWLATWACQQQDSTSACPQADQTVAASPAPAQITSTAHPTNPLRVNLLGVTPQDFSLNDADTAMKEWLQTAGFSPQSCWAMGETLDSLIHSTEADVNLVVTYGGLGAARILQQEKGIPYVIGTPIGAMQELLAVALRATAEDKQIRSPYLNGISPTTGQTDSTASLSTLTAAPPLSLSSAPMSAGTVDNPAALADAQSAPMQPQLIVGESIYAQSLAAALEAAGCGHYQVIVPVETERTLLRPDTLQLTDETDLIPRFAKARTIIADPMYAPIITADAQLIRLPHEGFSGRLYAKEIPNLITRSGFTALRAKCPQ